MPTKQGSERVPQHYEDAYGWCAYVVFDLEAERDRYRAALEKIASTSYEGQAPGPVMRTIAREALDG